MVGWQAMEMVNYGRKVSEIVNCGRMAGYGDG